MTYGRFSDVPEYVKSISWAIYCHLKKVHCLKVFLTRKALARVVNDFITTHKGYCNSLSYLVITSIAINCSQSGVATIVTNTKIYYRKTKTLRIQHWMKVTECMNFIKTFFYWQWILIFNLHIHVHVQFFLMQYQYLILYARWAYVVKWLSSHRPWYLDITVTARCSWVWAGMRRMHTWHNMSKWTKLDSKNL